MKYFFFDFLAKKSGRQVLSVFFSSVFLTGSVEAKEYFFQPSVNIRTEYSDNKRLVIEDNFPGVDPSSYGVITRTGVKLGVKEQRYEVVLDPQFIFNRYASDFDLDSEDFKVYLKSKYNLTPANQLMLNADFTQNTTLTSEFENDASGLVGRLEQENNTRQQWSVSPSWIYYLSNDQSLQAAYSHSDTQYEDSSISSFSDYTVDFATLSFRQQWTPLLANTLSVSAMYFDIPKIGSGVSESSRDTLEYSVNIGTDYQISPTWSASLTLGGRFTNTDSTPKFKVIGFDVASNSFIFGPDGVTISDEQQGFIFSFNVNKKFESGNVGVSYSRSTNAQGNGKLQVRDNFNINYQHNLTSRLQLLLNGGVNDISTSGSVDDGDGRTYYHVRPSIRWRFDRRSTITVEYQYRRQDYERDDDTARSNSVSLYFNYQWDKVATQKY